MGATVDASVLLPLIGLAVRAVNGLAGWLLTYAIHSTLLIGGLLLVAATPAGRRLAAAHGTWFWRFALVGAIASASLQSLRAAAPLGGTVRLDRDGPVRTLVQVAVHEGRGATPSPAAAPGTLHWTARTAGGGVRATMIDIRPWWPVAVVGAWFALAAALLGWFAVARARFLHGIGPRRDGRHTLAGRSLRHLQQGAGVAPATLTIAECLTSPVALGGREICLPARALADLDPIRLESILAHELAHLERRDPFWLALARIVEAIFFFQPLNRVARRRLQESAEFASDAWAAARIARPLDLAHCLARVAEWTIAAPRVPVPAMAERRGPVLVRRVERLATGRLAPEATPGTRVRLAAAAALVALVLFAPRGDVGAEPAPWRAAFSRPALTGAMDTAVGPAGARRRVVFVRRELDGAPGVGLANAGVFMVRLSVDSGR